MSAEATPRILICRMGAIGDTILTLPVACALREHFPEAYIGWAVEKAAAPLIRHHPSLDTVIELDRGWNLTPRSIRQARRELQSHRFDVSIDCQGTPASALAGWLSGAEKRIGFAGVRGKRLGCMLTNSRIKPVFTHLTDQSLELLIPLEINSPKVRWKLPIPTTSRTWAARFRRTVQAESLAVLNPGAAWDSKQWEPDRFGATARYLNDRYGYRSVVVWGNLSERLAAEQIVACSRGAASLAPATDLNHLAALIETADLFISGDTGPLHMAVAVGTSTIGLYGATRPGDSGPYGQIALQNALEGGSLWHRRNKADNAAMRQIGVEHVCEAIDELEAKRRLLRTAA